MTAPAVPRQALERVVQQRNPALTPDIISASSAVSLLKIAGAPLSDLSELISACEDSGFQQGLDAVTELRVETFAQTIAERLIRLETENTALRAQAAAAGNYRAALAHYAELRHYDHAGRLWSGDPDEHEDAQVDFGEIARAALAQALAGAESEAAL